MSVWGRAVGLAFGPRSRRCAPEAAADGRVFALRVAIAEAISPDRSALVGGES